MSINFNVSHISYRFFCDKLSSIDLSKDLIIESSANNIEFKSNNKNIHFNNPNILNYGLNMDDKDLSNIQTIRGNLLNIDTLFLSDISNSRDNIIDDNFVEDGYIRRTIIGYNPVEPNIIGARDGYFRYINVSGGDSSFNNSVYIKKNLDVSGSTTISNDLIVNGASYITTYNSINNYIASIVRDLSTTKIVTKDLSAANVSISNDLVVAKTSFINDLTIGGHLLDNILKVPHDFMIDPSPYNDISGTLIINGDLIVYGNKTTIASSIIEISDITLNIATNLTISNDLYWDNAGLAISNVASLKYDGTNWNFEGGQLSVENKKVSFDSSLIALKNSVDSSLNILNSSFDLSYSQLKQNIDSSFTFIYTKSQIDNSFLLIANLDLSLTNYKSYVDNSFVNNLALDASFSALQTYLDASYIVNSSVSNLNVIDSSLIFLSNKLDLSYVSKSVFDDSYNNLKSQIDNSFASISITSLDTLSIRIETINTKHYSQRFNNTLWNQFGLDISTGLSLTNNNNKLAISNDGKVLAFASAPVLRNAFGGAITISGGYVIHRFDTNGTFTSTFNGTVEVLVVGGGGGGGPKLGGGGGGGGVIYMPSVNVTAGSSYNVVVGAGGQSRTIGQASSVFGAIAAGGGTSVPYTEGSGTPGGSGGGAPATESGRLMAQGGATSGNSLGTNSGFIYGNRGGNNIVVRTESPTRAAGGGGAGGPGLDTNSNTTGNTLQEGMGSGGVGIINAILGPSYYWGGGGGGSAWDNQFGGWGGLGGGGGGAGLGGVAPGGGSALNVGISGGLGVRSNGGAGGANTGGGGGGGTFDTGVGGIGGSGIVVIRYLQLQTVSGSILNLSSWQSDISRGRIYVYEMSYNETSYNWIQLGLSSEIIVGASNEDNFGWDLALSSNGRVVAGSSITNDASGINNGQVRVYEVSNNTNNTNRWIQKGFNINGPRPGSESGYSISLAGNGNRIAVGAWKDNLNGTNAGAVRVYDFSAGVNDWRQQGQTISGGSGSFEGYATALSLDGQTLASASIPVLATGGTLSNTSEYTIHSFTNVGTTVFTVTTPLIIDYLVIAGGGSGGAGRAGGGGAGGVSMGTTRIAAGSYTITVGAGGASASSDNQGNDGGSSSIGTLIVATGGGGGGGWTTPAGKNGGSGGGSGASNVSSSGTGIVGQGFAGSTRLDITTGGGGGGAGGVGGVGSVSTGGIGITSNITGTLRYYAGGGGGGATSGGIGGVAYGGTYRVANGIYGGGNGTFVTNQSQLYTNAVPNTGGGGGGNDEGHGQPSGAGGSGIVIIRYITTSNVTTFAWLGTFWSSKGIIRGSDISGSFFVRSIKLSANGNTIIIGAPGNSIPNEYLITPIYEYNSSLMTWQNHRNNALTVFGRDLAVISNPQQNAVANALRPNLSDWAWLGGRRRSSLVASPLTNTGKTAADWEWVTGEVWNYQNFGSGQPDNLSENAIHFWTAAGGWNDLPSTGQYAAIYMYYKARSINVGGAYVYGHQGGTTWTQLGQTLVGISGANEFGSSVNISNDGTIISVGTTDTSSNRGYVNVYKYVNNFWTQIGNTFNGKVASFKAGLNALSGDGTTLIQSNPNFNSVYGINKTLALNSPMTSISGNLIVIGNAAFNSLDISRNHSYSSNGYSYKVFESALSSAIMKEYYSDVTSTRFLKVQILGNGNITNRNNSYRSLSDSRLKENIVTSGPKLEDLLKVRVVNYNLKGSNSTKYIGVLAQELEGVFPNLVTEIEPSPKDVEEGRLIKYKAVNYSSFDALLIKSLQEQNAMLKNITQRIEALEKALG
jgi:hypothetical protein